MNNMPWRDLLTKVKYALGVSLALCSAFLIGALAGEMSWKDAGVKSLIALLPALVAYLKPEKAAIVVAPSHVDVLREKYAGTGDLD